MLIAGVFAASCGELRRVGPGYSERPGTPGPTATPRSLIDIARAGSVRVGFNTGGTGTSLVRYTGTTFTGVNWLIAQEMHTWLPGYARFQATTKWDATFRGQGAHAGAAPHAGRNALLAAATATLNLHAISRHGGGDTRVNVGMLQAGEARNSIPAAATLRLEVRGDSEETLGYMAEPSQLAGTVLFLASDHAGYITGATINVSGGWLMY